ncbi:hypothetical protein B484DRAFT_203854 [Ochromonadaceae sp. CCMP2298]|nr:hypothetical protein B484DRAFT_203854 [Ochromonadaceae sp. CCMP2298]
MEMEGRQQKQQRHGELLEQHQQNNELRQQRMEHTQQQRRLLEQQQGGRGAGSGSGTTTAASSASSAVTVVTASARVTAAAVDAAAVGTATTATTTATVPTATTLPTTAPTTVTGKRPRPPDLDPEPWDVGAPGYRTNPAPLAPQLVPASALPLLCRLLAAAGTAKSDQINEDFRAQWGGVSRRQAELKINEMGVKKKRPGGKRSVWHLLPEYERFKDMTPEEAEEAASQPQIQTERQQETMEMQQRRKEETQLQRRLLEQGGTESPIRACSLHPQVVPDGALPLLCRLVAAAGSDDGKNIIEEFRSQWGGVSKLQARSKIKQIAIRSAENVWRLRPDWERFKDMTPEEAEEAASQSQSQSQSQAQTERQQEYVEQQQRKEEAQQRRKPAQLVPDSALPLLCRLVAAGPGELTYIAKDFRSRCEGVSRRQAEIKVCCIY